MIQVKRHKKLCDTLWSTEGNFLKRRLTYSYSCKCNEINICHSDIQKHDIYKKKGINSININFITGFIINLTFHFISKITFIVD